MSRLSPKGDPIKNTFQDLSDEKLKWSISFSDGEFTVKCKGESETFDNLEAAIAWLAED